MSTTINTLSQRERTITSIEELEKKAEVIKGLNLPMEIWVAQANRLYEQANISNQKGDLVNAYIQYFKFNNIVASILPQHNVDLQKKAFEVSSILSYLRNSLANRYDDTQKSLHTSLQLNPNQVPSKKNSIIDHPQDLSPQYPTVSDTSHAQSNPVSQKQDVPLEPSNSTFQIQDQPTTFQSSTDRDGNDGINRESFSVHTMNTSTHEFDSNVPDIHESMLRFPQVEHIHDISFSSTISYTDLDIEKVSQRYPCLNHVDSFEVNLRTMQQNVRSGKIPVLDSKLHDGPENTQKITPEDGPKMKETYLNNNNVLQEGHDNDGVPLNSVLLQDKRSKNSLDKSRSSFKLNSLTRAPSRRWFSSSSISQTSFAFPHANVISTNALHQYLNQSSNPPSILLMDIRPREEFQKGHIDAKYIINIDPIILKNETTSSKIEAALQLCSTKERSLFNERHKVDLIVFYDQSSTSLTQRPIELGGNLTSNPLQHLVSAIYEREFEKVLIRMPVLLSGGYQAWISQYGERPGSLQGPLDPTPRQNHHFNRANDHTSLPHVDIAQNSSQDWFNNPQNISSNSQSKKFSQDNTSSEQIDMLVNKLNQSIVITPTTEQPIVSEVRDYFQQNPILSQNTTKESYIERISDKTNISNQHTSPVVIQPESFSRLPKPIHMQQYNSHSQQYHPHPPTRPMLQQQQQQQVRMASLDLYRPLQPRVVSRRPHVSHRYISTESNVSWPNSQQNAQNFSHNNDSAYYSYSPLTSQHYEYTNASNFEPLRMPQPEHYFPASSSQIPRPMFPIPNQQIMHNNCISHHSNGSKPNLRRRKTFLDNPYYGFTATNNNCYDPPPPLPERRPVPFQNCIPNSQLSKVNQHIPALQQQQPIARPNLTQEQIYDQKPKLPMRMASPTFESSVSQLGSVRIGITGLKNLGNTCFMNSVLQCLSATVPLARYFLDGSYKRDINTTNFLGTGGVLAQAFGDLIRVMWSVQYTFVSPVTFRDAIAKFAPQFKGSDQQDSQELLGFLLDGLHEDLNLIITKPPPDNDEDDEMMEQLPEYLSSELAWEKYLLRNSSIIVNLFQGQFRSKLRCTYCKQTSTTYNPFTYLSLPIPSRHNGIPISRCLEEFVKEETLDGEDAWFCPRCKTRRRAIKRLTLSRLPDVLLIHLKRFSFSGPFRDKLDTLVSYPLRKLDMRPYLQSTTSKAPTTYDLYAVSNHVGGLNGGHYTAQVRNGYRNQWCNFDDSRVSVCHESTIVSKSAYILFYVRTAVN